MADNYDAPQSREEAILQNINGAENVLEPPQSRNEEILTAILDDTEYNKPPESRIEGLLIDLKVKINNMIPEPTANIDITSNASNIDVKSYATANVSVPTGVFPSGVYSIAANGDYDIASYASAHVAVPMPSGVISITANASNIDVASYAAANVNVPQGITPTGTYNITSNGVYDVASYASASVNVSGGGEDPLLSVYRTLTKRPNSGSLIDWEDNIDRIGNYAFAGATILRYASGVNVSRVDSSGFLGCNALVGISFPNVTYLGEAAFQGCNNLSYVELPKANVFSPTGGCFMYCTRLKEVNMSSVEYLPPRFFEACYALETVSLPSLARLRSQDFASCSALSSLSLSLAESVSSSMDSGVFANCINLETLYMPLFSGTSAGYIPQSTFYHCEKLSSLTLDFSRITSMAGYAFAYCYSLPRISLPNVTSIDSYCFYSCSMLSEVSMPKLTNIASYGFGGTLISKVTDGDMPLLASIGAGAFKDCPQLSLVSHSTYSSSISMNAFENCGSLTKAYLPQASALGNNAFRSCFDLTEVWLGKTNLASYVFSDCSKLESLYMLTSVVPTLNANAFKSSPFSDSSYLGHFASIYVYASMLDAFKAATSWKTYSARMVAYTP